MRYAVRKMMSQYGMTKAEWRTLRGLRRPEQVQRFLDDSLAFNMESGGATCYSPRLVLRHGLAHCMEGALLAAAALRAQGRPALLLDQPGRPGNFDCSRFVAAIEKPLAADRSLGDVHPLGNPHYHLSPGNMRNIAEGISRTLSQLDPGNASFYQENASGFRKKLDERRKEWGTAQLRGKKFVSYHKYFEYLAQEYGFQLVGYIEAKPGIPPSPGHIESLIELAKGTKLDGILTTAYFPRTAPDFLARKTGLKVIVIPHEVGATPQATDWFKLMDLVFASLS